MWPQLHNSLVKNKIPYSVLDITDTSSVKLSIEKAPELRDYQSKAVEAILKHKSGRIIMPTGSGKTLCGLGAVKEIGLRSLVLVSKLDLVNQWVERSEEFLNYTPGTIGDNKWAEKDFTIATFQTLWSKREEISQEWWNSWDLVIHEEQHHIPAETISNIISKFRAPYRIGVSATEGKSASKKQISKLIFGPIIYEHKETQVDPLIVKIETDFDFDYKPTRKTRINGKIKVERNNYQQLIKALVEDKERNEKIASLICLQQSNCSLVISSRLKHLGDLHSLVKGQDVFHPDKLMMLTGKESTDQRKEIIHKAEESCCVIFSTIADEGLDIPRLDRLFRVYPSRNEETLNQQVGRIRRKHPDKKDSIVFDFLDLNVPVLKGQYNNRLYNFYRKQNLQIIELQEYLND